jgi:hypothetical protein
VRRALVAALAARAESCSRPGVRRFLRGLSCDELQFIAAFLGACILESTEQPASALFADRSSEDRELKLILLVEYLCRAGIGQTAFPVPAVVRGWQAKTPAPQLLDDAAAGRLGLQPDFTEG